MSLHINRVSVVGDVNLSSTTNIPVDIVNPVTIDTTNPLNTTIVTPVVIDSNVPVIVDANTVLPVINTSPILINDSIPVRTNIIDPVVIDSSVPVIVDANTVLPVINTSPILINDSTPVNTNVGTVQNCVLVSTVDDVKQVDNVDNIVAVENVISLTRPYFSFMNSASPDGSRPVRIQGKANVGNSWGTVVDAPGNDILELIPDATATLAVSASFDGVPTSNQEIRVLGYRNQGGNTLVNIGVTIDGVNKIVLPGSWYRIVDMFLSPTVGLPTQMNVYLYDATLDPGVNGIPPSFYDFMEVGPEVVEANFRETAIYYSPPGYNTYINSIWATIEPAGLPLLPDVRVNLCIRLKPPNTLLTYDTILHMGESFLEIRNPQINIPAGWTMHILCQRGHEAERSTLDMAVEMVQVPVP